MSDVVSHLNLSVYLSPKRKHIFDSKKILKQDKPD